MNTTGSLLGGSVTPALMVDTSLRWTPGGGGGTLGISGGGGAAGALEPFPF